MNVTAQIENSAAFPVTVDNQIRLIERLVMPKWDRDKLKFCPMGDVWKSADPGRIELARGKKGRDFLIGASGNQGKPVYPVARCRYDCKPSKKFKVVG